MKPLFAASAIVILAWAQGDAPPASAMVSTMDGVYTTAQAARGEETYMGLCVSCHPVAVHTGPTFKAVWGGRQVSDLYAAIRDKMPKNDPGSLTPEESAQVVAYLLKLNDVPAGATALPADAEALKKIRIETPLMREGKP